MKLSDAKCRNIKPTEKIQKLTDGAGLYLEVKPSGAKKWRYRYRIAGKETIFTIGDYPTISLSEARIKRQEATELVKEGKHPTTIRQSRKVKNEWESVNTFQELANEWIEKNKSKWSENYKRQIEINLRRYVFPSIGKLPIKSVESAHILVIVQKIEKQGVDKRKGKKGSPSIALLVKQWCGAIFRYAVVTLRAEYDPAAPIQGAITRPRVRHHPHLEGPELSGFMRALNAYEERGMRQTIIALRLLLLTFVRNGELRLAIWDEFDLENAIWRIPGERMKMREPHVVPLSKQAMQLLRELKTFTGPFGFIFPNRSTANTAMSNTTINRAIEYIGYKARITSHGFRGTASTVLHEHEWPHEIIERQLAHAERNSVVKAYNHAQHLSKRREMMQWWADYLDEIESKALEVD
ncbi:MAG: tyrosine-type recombinase/integrase [Porticoccaceae bacterium]